MTNSGTGPRRLLAAVGITAIIGYGIVLPPRAALADTSSDQPIALQADQGGAVLDVTGEALSVLSDSDELGERVIFAENENGDPAKVVVQSAPAADVMDVRLFETEESSAPFMEQVPELVVEEVSSALLTGDEAGWSVTSSFATTETTASFRWDEAVDGFSAVMDGSSHAVSSGEIVAFEGLAPGSSHEVVLTGSIGKALDGAVESQKTFSITTLGGSTKSASGTAARIYQPYTTAYLHKTFIPPASVNGAMCNFGRSEYTFKGDNRGYRMPAADTPYGTRDYRTMMFANVNWDNPAPYTVVTAKDVGQSVTLKNGAVAHASYAPSDQMKFEEIQSGGAYAQVRFNHSASNPHCKIIDVNYGGSIRYNEIVRFYRSGIVEVVGYRRAAPAHEMYARFSNAAGIEAWTIVSRRDLQSFNCLVETLCALDNYALSKTY